MKYDKKEVKRLPDNKTISNLIVPNSNSYF